jgi:dethiobiotin synthetase
MVPLDQRHTVLDLMRWLRLPVVVVARAGLGTINHTLLTLHTLRDANISVAGIVINRYPAENASVAEETNPRVIEKLGKVPILCIVPEEKVSDAKLPPGIISAVEPVDWERFSR